MTGPNYPNQQTEDLWFSTILKGLSDRWCEAARHGHWWIRAAAECVSSSKAQLITSRDGKVVYMLRCWLSLPKPCTAGQNAKYESGDANLLHWILQPDDIPHLHNHPWEFETRLLSGGYVEERDSGSTRTKHTYLPGSVVKAGFHTYHRIASHVDGNGDPHTGKGGTWSLVTTSSRAMRWQFRIEGAGGLEYVDAESFLKAQQ